MKKSRPLRSPDHSMGTLGHALKRGVSLVFFRLGLVVVVFLHFIISVCETLRGQLVDPEERVLQWRLLTTREMFQGKKTKNVPTKLPTIYVLSNNHRPSRRHNLNLLSNAHSFPLIASP